MSGRVVIAARRRAQVEQEQVRQANTLHRLAAFDAGLCLLEWARAVQRGDPDAAAFLGVAKAAALEAVVQKGPRP